MAAKTQSVIDRIDAITSDPSRRRFKLARIALWMNDMQRLIAELAVRAASEDRTLTLAAGVEQDLRALEPGVDWIKLHRIKHNVVEGLLIGAEIREVDPVTRHNVAPLWRRTKPSRTVQEYALDPRLPTQFEVFPPAVAGTQVRALVSVAPPPVCVLDGAGTALANPNEVIGLAAGFDGPLVDLTVARLFMLDAGDASYQARAAAHIQAAERSLGVTIKAGTP